MSNIAGPRMIDEHRREDQEDEREEDLDRRLLGALLDRRASAAPASRLAWLRRICADRDAEPVALHHRAHERAHGGRVAAARASSRAPRASRGRGSAPGSSAGARRPSGPSSRSEASRSAPREGDAGLERHHQQVDQLGQRRRRSRAAAAGPGGAGRSSARPSRPTNAGDRDEHDHAGPTRRRGRAATSSRIGKTDRAAGRGSRGTGARRSDRSRREISSRWISSSRKLHEPAGDEVARPSSRARRATCASTSAAASAAPRRAGVPVRLDLREVLAAADPRLADAARSRARRRRRQQRARG